MSPPVLYAHYVADDACRFHRLLQPFRFLQPRHPEVQLVCAGDPNPEGADAYLFHGVPSRIACERIGRWKRTGAVAVWSVDDDYLTLPDWNGNKMDEDDLDRFAAVRDLADLILCSTPALGETFRAAGYGDKVCVAPNLLDLEMYPAEPPAEPAPGKPVRVLWSGSITHSGDLAVAADGVAAALDALPRGAVEVVFLGAAPPHPVLRDRLHKGVVWQPPVPFAQYWSVLAGYSPHVFLAPLADCEFNRSKSNLRVIEGFALNAAVIVSPVGEYKADGTMGSVWYAPTPSDWANLIVRLVGDAGERRATAASGRRYVERHAAWQNPACHGPWDAFLGRVLELVSKRRG